MLPYIETRAARAGRFTLGAIALLAFTACSDSNPTEPGANDRLSIVAPSDSVFEGDVVHLSAQVLKGSVLAVPNAQVTWSVSDTSLASIGSDGSLTLKRPGTVRVTALSDVRTSSLDVVIGQLVAKKLEATITALHLGRGDIMPVPFRAIAQGGRVMSATAITYSSDDSVVATPNVNGMVFALSAGATTVRATVGNLTAQLPVDVVVADTTFQLTEFNGAALPVLFAADSVTWDGVAEYHELYVDGGTLVLSGLQQLRYKVDIRYTEYNVIREGANVRREVRRSSREFDRGIVDVGAAGRLAMTSEYISPLAHTADLTADGYLVHFRIPGDDIIWNVKYRRVAP